MHAPVAITRVAIGFVLLAALAQTHADPDLWGHVLGGRDIAAAGGPLTHDPYAFTSDRPWTNHNWLGELVLWLAYAAAGSAGLVGLKLVLVLGTLGLVVGAARRVGAPPAAVDLLAFVWVAGAFAATLTMRPQLFSVLFFALELTVLVAADAGRARALLFLPLLFALWANVHGGWVLGAGVLVLWATLRLCLPTPGVSRLGAAATLAASLLATLCTPYGLALWRFVVETVPTARPDIGEWRGLRDAPMGQRVVWLCLVLVAAVGLLAPGARPSPFATLTVLALAAGALRTRRLGVFFATGVVVLLAPQLGAWWTRVRTRRLHTHDSPLARRVVPVIAAVTIVVAALMGARGIRCIRMDLPEMPDLGAAAFIHTNRLEGRMVTWFDWGEYVMWHFGPRLRVSMDGRRETVYSDATLAQHRALYFDHDGAAYLAALDADYVWLPKHLPVVPALGPPAWTTIFASDRSIVLARPAARAFLPPAPHPPPPCFPAAPGG